MKGLFKGALVVGVAVGAAFAVKNLLDGRAESGSGEVVQITFPDGEIKVLPTSEIEGREFADIARKLVEAGL